MSQKKFLIARQTFIVISYVPIFMSFSPLYSHGRGRGYWRPNYVAYGRNIFPGGDTSDSDSSSSRDRRRSRRRRRRSRSYSSSSSRSSTPDDYKNTPEGQERSRTPSPEKGLMERIMEKKEETVTQDRLNQILQQLEDPNSANYRQGMDTTLIFKQIFSISPNWGKGLCNVEV